MLNENKEFLLTRKMISPKTRTVFSEVLSGTSSFGLRSLIVAIQYAGNSFIMSSLGKDEASAASVTTPGVAFFMGMMSGFLAAPGVELGKVLLKKDNEAVGAVIKTGWLMTIVLGTIAALGFLSTQLFLPLFLAPGVAKVATRLFQGYAIAAIPELWVWGNGQVPFKIEKNTYLPVLTAMAYRLSALGLSYIFANRLEWGAFGVGVGAAVSGVANVLLFQPWYSKQIYHQYHLYHFKINNFKKYISSFLATGWPISLQRISEWLNLFIIAQIFGAWSSEKLLAEQVSLALLVASGFMTQGSGQYSMMQVTQDHTAMKQALQQIETTKDAEHLEEVFALQQKNKKHFLISNSAGIIFNMGLAGLVYLLREQLIALYAPQGMDNTTKALAIELLLINALSLLPDCARNITAGVLRGWNDILFPTIVSLILMTGIAIPVGVALGLSAGETVLPLFIARLVSLVLVEGISIGRYVQQTRRDAGLYHAALFSLTLKNSVPVPSSLHEVV